MTRIVVTGAAGFIGSNIVKGLNARGIDDIIAVDDLTQGDKFRNLADLKIADYVDADYFYDAFADGLFGKVEAVFHEGACSDTMETDGKYMMDNNYTTSCGLFHACQQHGARLLYASSAATYGGSDTFRESPEFEAPLNVYGWSKLLFDQRLRREIGPKFDRATHQVVGTWHSDADLAARAHRLRETLGLEAVLVTLSEAGMTLFDAQGQTHVDAQAREVFDVTGAGDTVIATLAALVAAGLNLREAMPLANRAGGIVVGKFGTATVSYQELFA